MIGFSDYAVVKGKDLRTVEQIASFCSEETRQKMHEIGLRQVQTDNKALLADMIAEAYHKTGRTPDCVFVAHSLPFIRRNDGDIPGIDVPIFYLSGEPCAIMHKAVEMACMMIENNFYDSVMVIGTDKAYSDRERVFFDTIMGDAAAALLLEQGGVNKILASHVSTTIIAPDGENSSEEEIQKFRAVNVSLMRSAIHGCMEKAGVDKVDHFITHTSNRKFWDSLAALMKIPRELFLDCNICKTGHMNSHDSFIHYLDFCEQGVIAQGETVMLINPGFGGTQGCTIIRNRR